MNALFHILLSATLLNSALLAPHYFGFLSVLFWLPLWFCVRAAQRSFFRGFAWGLAVFGMHFVWLLYLLRYGTHIRLIYSVPIYLAVVGYYSLTSGLWWWATTHLLCYFRAGMSRAFVFLLSLAGYFYFINCHSVWFLTCTNGYPFFNPFLALTHYRWFRALFYLLSLTPSTHEFQQKIITPQLDNRQFSSQWYVREKQTPGSLSQAIYHAVSEHNRKENEEALFLLPESAFPYPINRYPEIVNLWSAALPSNAHLILGCQQEAGGKRFQSCIHILHNRIKDSYDKRQLVDYTETKEGCLYNGEMLCKAFGLRRSFTSGERGSGVDVFVIDGATYVPFLCSDFFCANTDQINARMKRGAAGPQVLLLLANDSWFPPYLRELMKRSVELYGLRAGARILYVAHQ